MSKGQVGSRITESQIITKTVRKVPGGKSELAMPFFQLLELPVSWAVGWLGGKSRTGDFLLMPTVEVPTLAPTTSAARVGNQQPTFFRASQPSCHFYFCNFVLMKSAFIPTHLHCPLFKSWRLQTYPGVIFKQTSPRVSRPLVNSRVWRAGLCSQASVEPVRSLAGTKLEVHVTRRETRRQ